MTYSCSDFTDDVLAKLVESGALRAEEILSDDPERQGSAALNAIHKLVAERNSLKEDTRDQMRIAELQTALEECIVALLNLADDAGDTPEWNEGGHAYLALQQAKGVLNWEKP